MLPYIHIIVPFYGVFVALGVMVSFLFFTKRSSMLSIDRLKKIQIAASASIGVLIGSRIVFVLSMLPVMMKDFSLQQVVKISLGGGFVFYGGLLGAIGALYLYGKVRKINTDDLLQTAAPCFPLFHAFGRIGCFMAGCCYGIPCSVGFPLAVEPDVKRFPVQLVEAFACIVLFVLLLVAEKLFPRVRLLTVYLVSYAVIRFGLEFLRGDVVRGFFGCFSTSQWISLAILVYYLRQAVMYRRCQQE